MVNSSWLDLNVHGRRLNKILKILERRFDKVPKDDIDGLARIAATIGNITRQQLDIIKLKENFDEIMSWFNALKQDELAIKRHNIKQQKKAIEDQKQEMQAMKNRDAEFNASNTKVTHPESKAKITYPKGKETELEM